VLYDVTQSIAELSTSIAFHSILLGLKSVKRQVFFVVFLFKTADENPTRLAVKTNEEREKIYQ